MQDTNHIMILNVVHIRMHGMNKKGTVFFIGQNGEYEGSAEPGLGNGKCPHALE
jgi:hypothetical protein